MKATEDVLIVREDLGPEMFTLVVRGDEVPAHLVDLPRVPRAEVPKPKSVRTAS
ncbi:hypothetical protein [Streptomyces endophyticus]|uniref:Uncharacterized protein n=1 Tax=Streptomyces endophyticus TaxID=714166 RepID=A0ABU6FCZ0_9ACTN|nr:hypothetical protein [Streptomyces endophyticus]MEB8341793.1 hypothetical protein [Streptomyces endophyticus]